MRSESLNKVGRPRHYALRAGGGFADHSVAVTAAALDELRIRVIDQVSDLPSDALRFVPEGTTLSIAALVEHLVWAEVEWIRRVSGTGMSVDLGAEVLEVGQSVPAGRCVVPDVDAGDLVMLCRRVRDEVTLPALASLTSIDTVFRDDVQPSTARGVLMHLLWHWTYHSGQIGLLREIWGSGYTWTFAAANG